MTSAMESQRNGTGTHRAKNNLIFTRWYISCWGIGEARRVFFFVFTRRLCLPFPRVILCEKTSSEYKEQRRETGIREPNFRNVVSKPIKKQLDDGLYSSATFLSALLLNLRTNRQNFRLRGFISRFIVLRREFMTHFVRFVTMKLWIKSRGEINEIQSTRW